jgi:hypothetical protein
MKRSAPPLGMQWNLPLVDSPALPIPEQRELTLALMELLIQVGRQTQELSNRPKQEGQNESETER